MYADLVTFNKWWFDYNDNCSVYYWTDMTDLGYYVFLYLWEWKYCEFQRVKVMNIIKWRSDILRWNGGWYSSFLLKYTYTEREE